MTCTIYILAPRSEREININMSKVFAVSEIDAQQTIDRFVSENFPESYAIFSLIIPGLFEPPVRTLRATIPENESHIFR